MKSYLAHESERHERIAKLKGVIAEMDQILMRKQNRISKLEQSLSDAHEYMQGLRAEERARSQIYRTAFFALGAAAAKAPCCDHEEGGEHINNCCRETVLAEFFERRRAIRALEDE